MATDKKFVVKNGLQAQNIDFVDTTTATPTATLTASMSAAGVLSFDSGTLEIDGANNVVNMTALKLVSSIEFEGATADANETTLTVTDPTADRTVTIPDASGTVLLGDSTINQTVGSTFTVQGNSSLSYPSYTTIFQVENTGGGTTALVLANDTSSERVTLFNVDGDFVIQNGLSEKGFRFSNGESITFEGSSIDTNETTITVTDPTADRTITLPDATGTVAVSVSDTTTTTQGDLNVDFTLSAAGNISATGDAHGLSTTDTPTFGNTTISTAGQIGVLTLQRTGTAGNHSVTNINHRGVDSASNNFDYARWTTIIQDNTDGSESAKTIFYVGSNGQLQQALELDGDNDQIIASMDLRLDRTNLIFEGATADAFETTLTVTDPTADRTITFPDATGTVALTADIPSLSGYLQNVVEDTTPQLGGGLDLNSNDITGTGNISITGNFTSSLAGTPEMLIQSTAASSQDAKLRIRGSRTTSISGDIAQIIFETNDTSAGSDVLASITAGKDTASTNKGQILFSTTDTDGGSPSEKLRIKSTGYTLLQGIGETSAQENTHFRINDLTSWAQGVGGTLQLSGKHGSDGVNYVFGTIKGIKENATDNNHSGALTFSTRQQGGAPTEQMRIDSNGNVGIGTISPNTALEVKRTSGTATIRVHADHETSPRAAIEFMRGLTDTFGGDAYTDWKLGQVGAGSQADFAIISHDTTRGANERLTLEYDTGNVGIGDSAPVSTLEISKSDQTNGTTLTITNAFNGSTWAVDDVIGTVDFRTDDASTTEPTRGRIQSITDSVTGTNWSYGTALTFSTAFNNTLSEAMRIDSGGNVGIGVDPSRTLHVGAGSVLIDNFSGSVGHMAINNATNNINNDYIRANIMMTRDEDQVVWNPSTNVWDFAGGSSTDWSMIAHHSDSLRFYTGAVQSGATTKDMATFKTDHLAMTVKTDGLVGIGTNSPGGQLHVLGGLTKLEVQNVPNGVTSSNASTLIEATEAQLQIMAVDTGSWASNIVLTNAPASGTNRHWTIHHTPTTHPTAPESLAFRYLETNTVGEIGGDGTGAVGETKMIISDGGNVGIGLDNPSLYKLQVEGGNVSFNNGSADTILNLETDAAGTYDVKFNMGSGQNGIATEGHQIWYDNSTGDTHFNNTFTSGSIRFHTATSTDKVATGTNERMTIDQNGTTTVQGVNDATLWLKGPPGTGGNDNEFRLISWGNPGTGPSQSLQQYSNGSIIHSYGETIDSVSSSNLDFYAGGNGQISFKSPVTIDTTTINFSDAIVFNDTDNDTGDSTDFFIKSNNDGVPGVELILWKNSSSPAINDELGKLHFYGTDTAGAGFQSPYTAIASYIDGFDLNQSRHGHIEMQCRVNGSVPVGGSTGTFTSASFHYDRTKIDVGKLQIGADGTSTTLETSATVDRTVTLPDLSGDVITSRSLAFALGAVNAYSNPTNTTVQYDYSYEAIRLYSSTDNQIGLVFPAFEVNSQANESFDISIATMADVASSSGLYLRIQEYDGATLPAGKTHICNDASNSNSVVQEDTRQINNWYENGSLGTAWTVRQYTYSPTSTAKWASILVLNWSGHGTNKLWVKPPQIARVGSQNAASTYAFTQIFN